MDVPLTIYLMLITGAMLFFCYRIFDIFRDLYISKKYIDKLGHLETRVSKYVSDNDLTQEEHSEYILLLTKRLESFSLDVNLHNFCYKKKYEDFKKETEKLSFLPWVKTEQRSETLSKILD